MAKDTNRFVVILEEGSQIKTEGIRQLLVDWKTGYGAGITPLLDAEGKPVITRL